MHFLETCICLLGELWVLVTFVIVFGLDNGGTGKSKVKRDAAPVVDRWIVRTNVRSLDFQTISTAQL